MVIQSHLSSKIPRNWFITTRQKTINPEDLVDPLTFPLVQPLDWMLEHPIQRLQFYTVSVCQAGM